MDALLQLDGEVFFIDPDGKYFVKFVVKSVPSTTERPHGLNYSLTLHGPDGERLVGFDNAHAVSAQVGPAARKRRAQDHGHRLKTIRPYDYQDAAKLLSDFWEQVESVLTEKGVTL